MGATLGKTIQRGIARGGCANETGMVAAGYGHAAAVGLCGSFRSGGRHTHRPLHFRVWRCPSPTSGRLSPTRAWPFIRPFRALSAPPETRLSADGFRRTLPFSFTTPACFPISLRGRWCSSTDRGCMGDDERHALHHLLTISSAIPGISPTENRLYNGTIEI